MIITLSVGIFYLIMGFFFLIIPLLFIKLGRPRDIIKSGFMILSGIFLLINKNTFNISIDLIFTLNAILIGVFFFENFSYRWNQLLDKEKYEIKSFNGFLHNFSLVFNIVKDGIKPLFFKELFKIGLKKNNTQKKWIREKDINNKQIANQKTSKESISNLRTTNLSTEDIINEEKNKKTIIKFDNK